MAEESERKFAGVHEDTEKRVRRAGAGNYLLDMVEAEQFEISPHYATGTGAAVRGERVIIVLVNNYPRGTGARLHTHANEQFNYVIKGALGFRVNDAEGVAKPGQMIYIPANAPHYTVSVGDEDAMYVATKDASDFIAGDPVDDTRFGPHYEPGFEPGG